MNLKLGVGCFIVCVMSAENCMLCVGRGAPQST